MLSGQITKATVQTMHECNRLLRFAKENEDVSLSYNHLCHPDELQLVCFFDAGFTARCDGSSQGGYITMMVHRDLLTSSEEGEYHVLDWLAPKLRLEDRQLMLSTSHAAKPPAIEATPGAHALGRSPCPTEVRT